MPKKKKATVNWTHWLFLIGLIIAILGTIWMNWTWVVPVILIIGIILGIAQFWTVKDTMPFFVAVITLLVLFGFITPLTYLWIQQLVKLVAILVLPGAFFMVIKEIWKHY